MEFLKDIVREMLCWLNLRHTYRSNPGTMRLIPHDIQYACTETCVFCGGERYVYYLVAGEIPAEFQPACDHERRFFIDSGARFACLVCGFVHEV